MAILPLEPNRQLRPWWGTMFRCCASHRSDVGGRSSVWLCAGVAGGSREPERDAKAGVAGHFRTRSNRTQGILVTAEFALALTLLAGAGLALHSFWNLSRIDLGVTTEHVLTSGLQPRATTRQGQSNTPAARKSWPTSGRFWRSCAPFLAWWTWPSRRESPWRGTTIPVRHCRAAGGQATTAGCRSRGADSEFLPHVRGASGQRPLSERRGHVGKPDGCGCERELRPPVSAAHDPLSPRLILGMPQPGQNRLGPPVMFQIVGVFHDIQNNENLAGAHSRRCSCQPVADSVAVCGLAGGRRSTRAR